MAPRRSEFKVTWWDRFLLGLAPEWGMRRLRARHAATLMQRHYEAAGGGRRTAGWYRSSADANAANGPSLSALRELSRDLRRNNGWARRAIRTISVNTVSWGIQAQPVGMRSLRATEEALNTWNAWASSLLCDYDGRLTFSGLQRLVMETVVESGEALVLRYRATSADDLPVPVRIRVLEPDYLDHLRDGITGADGGPIVNGIEFDRRGRRVAYWLYRHHPGALRVAGTRFESVRVPAEDVLHVYLVERPGQVRGVPWLAAAIAKLNDFDDYDDAILMQQKIAACFGAFVKDLDGMASSLGEQEDADEHLETLEPGQIQYLPPGKDIEFASPPNPTTHGTFTQTTLRRIAVTMGITYEDLTGDYSQVNFSSARMARLAHWANVEDWRWNMLIPQFCDGVWRWVMELAAGLKGWAQVPTAKWAPPPPPMLEPEKEGLAYTRLMRSGVMTLAQAIRERGEDPDSHLREIAEMNKRLDELGIILDSDPRRTSTSGGAQPTRARDDEDA